MYLNELRIGDIKTIKNIKSNLKKRLLDIGMVEGSNIECVLKSNGIKGYLIKGAVIAIRDEDCKEILVI